MERQKYARQMQSEMIHEIESAQPKYLFHKHESPGYVCLNLKH
jgi:hypothetical protein